MSKKAKFIFNVVSAACVIGCVALLYFGYFFFRERTTVFVLYTTYIVLLTGIIIFMVRRYIKTYVA